MIVFTKATKQFATGSYGIRDITFSVNPGDFLFITGKSGSGKTTLMKLLTKEYSLTDGEILVDEIALSKLKKSQVYKHRRKIGIIYQDYLLLPDLNVWENIALPLSVHGKSNKEIESRVTDLLKLVKLTDKAAAFPSELSGGEAQRISIARALATGPKIIFADEPTGNLDAENTRHIAALLQRINQLGTTIICATHDLSLLSLISQSRHIELENGAISRTSDAKKHTTPDEKTVATTTKSKQHSPETQDLKEKPSQTNDRAVTKKEDSTDDENDEAAEPQETPTKEVKPIEKKQSWWQKLTSKKIKIQPTEENLSNTEHFSVEEDTKREQVSPSKKSKTEDTTHKHDKKVAEKAPV